MSDADWRRLQRAWESNPGDQGCLSALLAARRRAGVPITRALLDARRFPARSFRCALPYRVEVTPRAGVRDHLTPVAGVVALPEHCRWTLGFRRPLPHEGALGALLFELEGQALSGLHLEGPGLTDAGLAELVGTDLLGLERLRLQEGEFGALGVASLATLADLVELELIGCGNVDDEALAGLAGGSLVRLELGQLALSGEGLAALAVTDLAELDVWGCSLSPEGFAAVASLGSLRDLRLRGTPVTDEAVEQLTTGLPQLETLDLGDTYMLSDAALEACAGLEDLRDLRFEQAPQMTDAGVAGLAKPSLRRLHLSAEQVGDEALTALSAGAPNLEALSTFGRQVTDEGLRQVATLTRLRELRLCFLSHDAGDAGFEALSALRELVELDLFACAGLSAAALPFVRQLPALRKLSISHTDVLHDDGPQALTGLPLTRLALSSVEGLHDEALAPLATLSALEVLGVTHSSTVDGSWLHVVSGLPRLIDLSLMGCPHLDPAALEHLTRAPQLQGLDVTDAESLEDASLAVLPQLTQLTDLTLSGCLGLTDAALAHVGRCAPLRTLSLDGCAGLSDEGLKHLRQLSSLEVLVLGGRGVTPMGVEVLRRALPGCDVLSTFEV